MDYILISSYLIKKSLKFCGDCILETEFYNNIYFVFDVYYLNGVDYSDKYILERIEPTKLFINELGLTSD